MIGQRRYELNISNSIDETSLSIITIKGADPGQVNSELPKNVEILRSIAHVQDAAAVNSVPFSGNSWVSGLSTTPPEATPRTLEASLYLVTHGGMSALGTQIISGRDFDESDFNDATVNENHSPTAHVALVSKTYAESAWPQQQVLGKVLYLGDNAYTVIGVVADVAAPVVRDGAKTQNFATVFFPTAPIPDIFYYVVRSNPKAVELVTKTAEQELARANPNALVQGRTFSSIRNTYFDTQRSMVWTLTGVCLVMLIVTGFGIVGLTSYWVHQRRVQIGIRRALGATRADIAAYFRLENFLIVSAGIVLGMSLAYGWNLYFSQYFELVRLAWYYFPLAAAMLWVIGQVAVSVPARRAASIAPISAMR
ncbi:ABC transporter permease [Dyella caseinilytica]|nr:ABC transporter permease [Dyella caseinilytica]